MGVKNKCCPTGEAQFKALKGYPEAFRSRCTLTHSSVVSLTPKQETQWTLLQCLEQPKSELHE